MSGGANHNVEFAREPCPDRILDDVGGAFGMGAVGGGIWHFVKGIKNSPSGSRLRGGIEAIRREAPKMGGGFAVWGGLFSMFDCTLVGIRKKEDPWNSIAAGFLTGGVLQLRTGLRSAAKSAAFGGVLLAMIEGLGIMMSRMTSPPPAPPPIMEMPGSQVQFGSPGSPTLPPVPSPSLDVPAAAPAAPAEAPPQQQQGWFSSWFGSGESQKESTKAKDLSEEQFSPPHMPDFQSEPNLR